MSGGVTIDGAGKIGLGISDGDKLGIALNDVDRLRSSRYYTGQAVALPLPSGNPPAFD